MYIKPKPQPVQHVQFSLYKIDCIRFCAILVIEISLM